MTAFPDSPPPPDRAPPAGRPGRSYLLLLFLVAVALAVATPLAAGRALKRIAAALHHGREAPAQSRERVLGADYVRAIAAIRASIPEDGAYALVEGGDPADGGALWVRYELAPRRALDLGRLDALPSSPRLEATLPEGIAWAVVSNGRYSPPTLLTRPELLHRPAGAAREPLAP